MVSKNRRLKVDRSLNEAESAACTVLKLTKYRSDIKYLSTLLQQYIAH